MAITEAIDSCVHNATRQKEMISAKPYFRNVSLNEISIFAPSNADRSSSEEDRAGGSAQNPGQLLGPARNTAAAAAKRTQVLFSSHLDC